MEPIVPVPIAAAPVAASAYPQPVTPVVSVYVLSCRILQVNSLVGAPANREE